MTIDRLRTPTRKSDKATEEAAFGPRIAMNCTLSTMLLGTTTPGNASIGTEFRTAMANLFSRLDILNHPDELLSMLGQLNVVVAGILLAVGVLCVLNGYKWHKWVIVACALLAGIGLGMLLSSQMNERYIIAGALGLLCAVIAHPLLRFAVAAFGAATGAFVGANVWTALGYAPETYWTGAAMGAIALGLASFIMFKHVVVLFTSIGGASLLVFSTITLALNVPTLADPVRESLMGNHLLVPLLVSVAAMIGLVLQEGRKSEPAPAPSGGGD